MTRRLVEGKGVGTDPDWFVSGLSPDLLAGIRRRMRWTAAQWGARLPGDALDDLLQDLLLRLWERGIPPEVESFPAYALRAASNLTIDAVRRGRAKKREVPTSTAGEWVALGSTWPPTPEQTAIGRDSLRQQLTECRRLLSARQYQVFALIYLAGFTQQEVGARMGLRPGRVQALLAGLRRVLEASGVVRSPVSRSARDA
ncbi:MAG TPA: sigma-70 family RNA polymerase sigma factor [Thermoanaerobaculia bacterium]|nr:sigma-70 family RNA polymerase sigma factor [Thermoanaerobaculia bacterium]